MGSAHDVAVQELFRAVENCKQLLNSYESIKFEITQCQYELIEHSRAIGELQSLQDPSAKNKIEMFQQQKNNCKARCNEQTQNLTAVIAQIIPAFQQGIEKAQYGINLLKNELEGWKIGQKMAHIGPRMEGAEYYEKLDVFDQKFEELGQQLKDLHHTKELCLSGMQSIEGQLGEQIKHNLVTLGLQIHNCMSELSAESVVIARQPPTFLIPCRPGSNPENEKGVRHPCVPLLRIMGGQCLGFRAHTQIVNCKVISEDSASKMLQGSNAYEEPEEVGTLLRNTTHFQSMPSGAFQAAFKNMQLIRFADDRESKIPRPRRRYYLVFEVEVTGTYFKMNRKILSLPFGIYVNIIQRFDHGGDAFLWWQLAFCQGNGVLCPPAPHKIPWDQAIEALCKKFVQLIEEPTKPYDYNTPPPPPAVLSDIARAHLAERANNNGFMTWETFWLEKRSCKRYDNRRKCQVSATFREWFYACASMVNKFLQPCWNKNLVVGFANRDMAKQLVSSEPQKSKMVIRFSDTNCGYLMITYYYPGLSEAKHLTLEAKLLEGMNMEFGEVVRRDQTLQNVHFIYPNIHKEALFGDLNPTARKGATFGYEVTTMEPAITALPEDIGPMDNTGNTPVPAAQIVDPFDPDNLPEDEMQEMPDQFFDFHLEPTELDAYLKL